jgi:hypothetical protein
LGKIEHVTLVNQWINWIKQRKKKKDSLRQMFCVSFLFLIFIFFSQFEVLKKQ